MQSRDQYHTDNTHIPSTITTQATSSVQPGTTELPIVDRSLDSFALKSFQYPDSMPVYLKGKCLRHCSTSNSNDLSDHYPFQVTVSIHGRDFRKVLDAENIFGRILNQNFKTLKVAYLFVATLFLPLHPFYSIIDTDDMATMISKSLLVIK